MCKLTLKYLILESKTSSYCNFFEDIYWVPYRWLLLQNCCATSNYKTQWPGTIGIYLLRVHLCCSADLNWACCCPWGWSRVHQVLTGVPHLKQLCTLYVAFSSSSCTKPSHVMSEGKNVEARHTSVLQVSSPMAPTNMPLATAGCRPTLRCGELCPAHSRKPCQITCKGMTTCWKEKLGSFMWVPYMGKSWFSFYRKYKCKEREFAV